MKGNTVGVFTTLAIAFAILSVSMLKIASVDYAYSPMVLSEITENEEKISIDYVLSYPGKIGPDSPLWYAKAARDKAWMVVTFNKTKKAQLNLLFADKRLNSSLELFKNGKPDLGLATLAKSERYLDSSEAVMEEDYDFYKKLALASLKHREVIETEILPLTPDDLRPEVIKTSNYSKEVYKKVRDHMLSKGLVPPIDPFETN